MVLPLAPARPRRADLSSVLHTRSYYSADCDMDHSLVASKVRLKPRKIHHGKTKGCPRINTCGTSDPVIRLRALLAASRRNLLRNQQPATQMPNGVTSVMPSMTQPWLHSARENARMLTDSRLAGKNAASHRGQEESNAGSQAEPFPKHMQSPSSC